MRILLIEDDKNLSESIKFRLEKEDFSVDICHDGEEGLYYMKEQIHDLVILDRMLPSMDGVSVLKKARRDDIFTPVIMLTALGELNDRLTGLNEGADDYIVKPFAFEELLARINCIARRPGRWQDRTLLSMGDIYFDPHSNRMSGNGKECTLSKREGALLELFLRNQEQTLPRMVILNHVWGLDSDVEDGNLDNYIHFLRRRLKSVKSTLNLKTVRGIGYRLEIN